VLQARQVGNAGPACFQGVQIPQFGDGDRRARAFVQRGDQRRAQVGVGDVGILRPGDSGSTRVSVSKNRAKGLQRDRSIRVGRHRAPAARTATTSDRLRRQVREPAPARIRATRVA